MPTGIEKTSIPFFNVLYDEPAPTSDFGGGAHVSVYSAIVFPDGKASEHRFAVIWDRDHDTRILDVVERVYRAGILHNFIFFGERKGHQLSERSATEKSKGFEDRLHRDLTAAASDVGGDNWSVKMCGASYAQAAGDILDASHDQGELYLRYLRMVWKLGAGT